MAGMTNASAIDLLNLIFLNVAWANVGNAGGIQGSTVAGSLYISLHNADPGVSGTQSTNETGYTNYARIGVVRTGSGWSLASETMSNVATISFATCGVTGDMITYVAVGLASSGAGEILCRGALTSPVTVTTGIAPTFAAGALTVTAS